MKRYHPDKSPGNEEKVSGCNRMCYECSYECPVQLPRSTTKRERSQRGSTPNMNFSSGKGIPFVSATKLLTDHSNLYHLSW